MATLHVISKPSALGSCLEVAGPEDTLLLIENGAYCAVQSQPREMRVIGSDLAARGLAGRVAEKISVVNYEGFVDLVAAHQPIVSWG